MCSCWGDLAARFDRSVLALRPRARIVPTGGIALGEVPSWLQAGAFAVGVGAGLLDEPDLASRVRALHSTSGHRSAPPCTESIPNSGSTPK